jgi:RecA/RadA recombinase
LTPFLACNTKNPLFSLLKLQRKSLEIQVQIAKQLSNIGDTLLEFIDSGEQLMLLLFV